MPRKTRQPDDDDTLTPQSPDDYGAADAAAEISEIMDRMNGGQVNLARRRAGDVDYAFVGSMALDDFSLEKVQERFGGGRFQITFLDETRKFAGRKTVSIEEPPKAPAPPPPPPTPTPAATEALNTQQLFMHMLSMQQQSSQQMVAIISAALGRPLPPSGPSVIDQLGKLAPLVTPLITKALEARASGGSNPKEMLEIIKTVREEFGGSATEGDGGGGDGLGAILGPLLQIFARQQAEQPPPPPPPPTQLSIGAPAPGLSPPPGNTLPASPMDPPPMNADAMLYFVRTQLPTLAKAAQRNSDPASYADVILDRLDDEAPDWAPALLEVLRQDGWRQILFGQNPLPFDPWFVELREALIEGLQPEETPLPAPEAKKGA